MARDAISNTKMISLIPHGVSNVARGNIERSLVVPAFATRGQIRERCNLRGV